MSESARIGLDNPAFNGRLRVHRQEEQSDTPEPEHSVRSFDQQVWSGTAARQSSRIVEAPRPVWQRPLSVVSVARPQPKLESEPAPEAQPALRFAAGTLMTSALLVEGIEPRPFKLPTGFTDQFQALVRYLSSVNIPEKIREVIEAGRARLHWPQYSRLQWALVAMAGCVFLLGAFVSLQGLRTNHQAAAQVTALSKKADEQNGGNNANSVVPSTNKPSGKSISSYKVAPDLPRYIKIPGLKVNARVRQVGTVQAGALGTPSNVYDTAWYTGSAKPGQPGAMLIDGHVSSRSTHGVFYGLKLLHPGDIMQIERGDGQVFNYRVIKTQVYSDKNVDMNAAMTPVTASKPGLNLITCTGKVKPGTNEFSHRLVVFTEQI